MAILEDGVRFPVDSLILGTRRFYGLCPDQILLNFYRVVSCVSRLNQIYGLQLNHHDINFMYSLCGNIRSDYYLKARDVWVWLISCLPDSNRNSMGEFVRVNGNWLADELLCPFSSRDVGWYRVLFLVLNLMLLLISLTHILTGLLVDLVQKGKDLNQTLGLCTWGTSTLCLGRRYLCTQTDSFGRPTWYSAATHYTLPGSRSARLC